MASVDGLVPITRAFLARYYDKYPCPDAPDDVARLTDELRAVSARLLADSPLAPSEERLAHETEVPPPHKVDHNFWMNREHLEEILFLLEEAHWPKVLQQPSMPEDIDFVSLVKRLQARLQITFQILISFQSKNADGVFSTVMTYMPQDFRGSLIRQQRERSEKNRQAEVDALIKAGGSIHDKYALLWKQQMDRRSQLAQLGSATGVYKALVKYLVGVPQVLLDFVQQINDEHGPMEEQRLRYGPFLYNLTTMVLWIHFVLHLFWVRFDARKLQTDLTVVLEQAVNVYTSQLEHFLEFIGEVFAKSPFLISAEDAGTAESRKYDDYKEAVVPAGKTHEVSVSVESVNSYIAWDFSLTQGKDIGFCLQYLNSSGDITPILPYKRCESDQGNFCTILPGCYKLVWDNSYSNFFKKGLRFKVDAIPPVNELPRPPADDPSSEE